MIDTLEALLGFCVLLGFFAYTVWAGWERVRRRTGGPVKFRRAIGPSLKFAALVWLSIGIGVTLIMWLSDSWESHVRNRTATVRQVFLHGANQFHQPEIYMDDGTVWVLDDAADDVRMIPGDKVRYENGGTGIPSVCDLLDVTTGYRSAEADRISAPFERTSCPAQAPF